MGEVIVTTHRTQGDLHMKAPSYIFVFISAATILAGCTARDAAVTTPVLEAQADAKVAEGSDMEGAGEPIVTHVRNHHYFSSVPDISSAADLAAVGTVTSISPGRAVGDEHSGFIYRDVEVSVSEVLLGPDVGAVTYQEMGWDRSTGRPLAIHDGLTPEVGDAILVFLAADPDAKEGRYFLLNSDQSVYILSGESVAETHREDALVMAVEKRSIGDLRSELQRAHEPG